MTDHTCPEYTIRRVSKADQIRFRKEYQEVRRMDDPGAVNIIIERGRHCTTFPHSIYAAFEKKTGLPIARIAIDGRPWADGENDTKVYYRYAYIDGILVSGMHQGCGIGSQLVQAVENEYRESGTHRGIYLHCDRDTIPFYQKLGYEVCARADNDAKVGRYHDYNHGTGCFDNRGIVVMYKIF
jgi:GNAT superfamily N-acetyltransferase